VLIADDHESDALAMAELLAPLGLQVVTVKSGDEAIRRAMSELFAVILLDIDMPGLDGYETARLLRQREIGRRTPIIFVTEPNDRSGEIARAYAAGAVDYLTKPIDPRILRAKVDVFATLFLQREALRRAAEAMQERSREALRAEAARDSAEAASRSKDEFLAMVSHELRTPLNAILGWAELLRSGKLPVKRVTQGIETIIRNARIQTQLVADLLDISRIVSGKFLIEPRALRVDGIVQSAVDSMRPQAGRASVELQLSPSGSGEDLQLDPQRIHQAVCNLVGNAIKFTPPGGHVSIGVERQPDAFVVAVSDSGRGIAADFLPYVFDRFAQANSTARREHGGLGLGLAIVRHIVECHGGSITAHSEGENRGATFTLRLPRSAAVPTVVENEVSTKVTDELRVVAADPKLADLTGLRLLVVDDEEDSRELLITLLRGAGAEVSAAACADEALGALTPSLDAVISDLAMPRRDGFDLARAIRHAVGSHLPLIAVSALTSNEEKARALEAGFASHVSKPYEADCLIALVGRLARGADRRQTRRARR
jgi:signal transduction histidine kinase